MIERDGAVSVPLFLFRSGDAPGELARWVVWAERIGLSVNEGGRGEEDVLVD